MPVIYLVSKTMREAPGAGVFTKSYLATQRPPRKPTNPAGAAGVYHANMAELQTPEGLPSPGLPLWSPTQSTHAPFSWSTERGSDSEKLDEGPPDT